MFYFQFYFNPENNTLFFSGHNFTVKNEPQPHRKSSTDFNKKINSPFLQEFPDLESLKKKKHIYTPKLKYFKFFWMVSLI